MRYLFLFLFYSFTVNAESISIHDKIQQITPNDVYEQLYLISKDIESLKEFFNIQEQAEASKINTNLYPRHMWQKSYELMYKINLLREKYGLPYISAPIREAQRDATAFVVYEQLFRARTELSLLKNILGVPEAEITPKKFTNIRVTDSFNFITTISNEMDLILGDSFSPSDVFAQAMRISEDVNVILDELETNSRDTPPTRNLQSTPDDSYLAAETMMAELVKIQRKLNIASIDYLKLKPQHRQVQPSDVFSMTGIILAELQTIKAHLGLRYTMTPSANRYTNMLPMHTEQVLGWNANKLKLIETIR
jgi:hypothetical protein